MENRHDQPSRFRFPTVHRHVVAFHLAARKQTEHVEPSRASRIRRATTNAVLALELASRGHRSTLNLRRAHEAISVCSCLFELVFMEERLEPRLHFDLRRQMEAILRGLDDLAPVPVKEWATITFAPAPPDSTDARSDAPIAAPLAELAPVEPTGAEARAADSEPQLPDDSPDD